MATAANAAAHRTSAATCCTDPDRVTRPAATEESPSNPYDGVLPDWAYELALVYAKRLGYRPDQIDDALQEIALAFSTYRFDPTRGACDRTARTALIRNVLQKVLRNQVRYANRIARLAAEPQPHEAGPDTVAQHELWQVVAALPAQDREVCALLAAGRNTHAIASELKVGWHTVERTIARIRAVFAQAGIDGGRLH